MTNLTQPGAVPDTRALLTRTIAYFTAFIALGLTTASLGPTLPGLAQNTQSDYGRISFLFVMRSLGYLLGSITGGRLYDRRPGNPIIAGGLAAISLLLFFVSIAPWIGILAVIIFLIGLAEGTIDVGGNTLLVWMHGDRVAPFMNGLHFTFGIGALLSPIIVAQAISLSGGIRWAYWVLGILLIPIVLWIARIPSPPHQNNVSQDETKQSPRRLLALIVLFFFLYVGAEGSFAGWIYSYTLSVGLGTETSAAYLTSLFWGALTVGRLIGIPLSARLRPSTILWIDLLGCVFSLGLINLFPGSETVLLAGTIGTGVFMASVFPTLINLAQQRMAITGRITSWFFVGASTGGMFLPWLIGQLFEPTGPQVTMQAMLANMFLSCLVFAAILRNDRSKLSPPPLANHNKSSEVV
jgi:FHS family Na+ dependent glucose MFS transporter 1